MDKSILKLYKGIKKDIKDTETYNTGLVGEALIVATYKQMTISDLEKMQFIIGKIIKIKKELKRVNAATELDSGGVVGDNNPKK